MSGRGGAVKRLAAAGLAGALSAASAIGLLAMSGWLISRSALRPPVLYLMVPVAAVQAFGLGRAGFRYAERLAGHDAALRLLAGLRTSAYGRLERLAPAGLAAFRSGDLMRRLVGDIDSLTDRWLRVRLPYAVAVSTGAGAVALESALLPPAGAVLAGSLIAAAVAAPLLAGFIARSAEQRLAPLRGELAAMTVDTIGGAGELAVFGGSDAALRAVRDVNDRLARCEARSAYARGIGAAVCVLAAGAAVWASLASGVQAVRTAQAVQTAQTLQAVQAASAHTHGRLAGVLLAVVVLLPLAVHEVFGGLAPAAQEIPRVRSAAARVREVMRCPDPVREPDRPIPLPEGPYHIKVRGLAARWSDKGPDVLRGVDLDLPAGSRTAVIGPSGAGKTTLAMVLLRFLDPLAGSVTLNGTDITALDGGQVRTVIGLCAQDAHIFDTTLRENLRLAAPAATDAELLGALGQARLADWVAGLPAGLGTPVGEHGARLSGGQRQRLALARVLLAGFPVVIFDEPAEHLDDRTAEQLTRDLLATTPGRTVVLITHRRIEGLAMDQVVQLRDGQATVNPSLCISSDHGGTVCAMTEYPGSGAPGADRPAYPPPPPGMPGQQLPQAPPVPTEYGYGQYGGQPVPAGMYYDQESGLLLPNGTELASIGRRIGAYFLALPLAIVTLGIGYIIWGLILWPSGRSPALSVLGMRVWKQKEQSPATFGTMALRDIVGGIIEGIWIIGLVSFILMCTGKERKPLHDMIAGTVVLHDPNKVIPT